MISIATTQRGYLELLKITKDLPFINVETQKSDTKERILNLSILGGDNRAERMDQTIKYLIETIINRPIEL